jgi:hypothetical protein
MTENWTTEFSEGTTDLAVPGTTVSSQQHTTGPRNKTTSHTVPGKPVPWLILGITAVMVGGVMLILTVLLIWWKRITCVRGYYSVAKQNHTRLHNQL